MNFFKQKSKLHAWKTGFGDELLRGVLACGLPPVPVSQKKKRFSVLK
jgi:hypothetical protein